MRGGEAERKRKEGGEQRTGEEKRGGEIPASKRGGRVCYDTDAGEGAVEQVRGRRSLRRPDPHPSTPPSRPNPSYSTEGSGGTTTGEVLPTSEPGSRSQVGLDTVGEGPLSVRRDGSGGGRRT